MKVSKHIFLQANTDNIIKSYTTFTEFLNSTKKKKRAKLKSKALIDFKEEVLSSTLIFSQGSMSLGDPIKQFAIDVHSNERVYFTILPLFLFVRHKLHFKDFVCENKNLTPVPELGKENEPVSFYIDVDPKEIPKPLSFSLDITLEYLNTNGITKTFDFTVDPVLRVVQD
ncbi:hypothetical protein [uncultured Kordia sp.]|uniref:hypothetical protein n=1 Tax=uncultured Kordia sp. TaxID=507699 RepID=UPI00261C48A6|nr:hypothetical protein [uncultured Kordia sp.]